MVRSLDENETMGQSGKVPIIIPKEGDFVAIEVMMDTLSKAGLMLEGYVPLRDESSRRLGLSLN